MKINRTLIRIYCTAHRERGECWQQTTGGNVVAFEIRCRWRSSERGWGLEWRGVSINRDIHNSSWCSFTIKFAIYFRLLFATKRETFFSQNTMVILL